MPTALVCFLAFFLLADGQATGATPSRIVGAPVEIIERATTQKTGVVRFAENGVASAGRAVMSTDTRLVGAGYVTHAARHMLLGPDALSPTSVTTAGLAQFALNGEASVGRAVMATDSRLSNSRTPTAHQSSHQIGGSDALPAASSGTAGLVKLAPSGAVSPTYAVEADDPRLSDSRTPMSHQSSHRIGGSDQLPAGDTSVAGLLKLAADGEASASKALASNDSRLSGGNVTPHAGTHRIDGSDSIGPSTALTSGLESAHDKGLFDKVVSEIGGQPVNPPPARYAAHLAYASQLSGTILYGGASALALFGPGTTAGATGYRQDTWKWDGREWTFLGDLPRNRISAGLVYDTRRGMHVLWSGGDTAANSFSDTWELDAAGGWKRRSPVYPAPVTGSILAGAYDPVRKTALTIAVSPAPHPPEGPVIRTWEYDGSDWKPINASFRPSWNGFSRTYAMAGSPSGTYLLTMGYFQTAELWKLSGGVWAKLWPKTWPQDPVTGQPPEPVCWNVGPGGQSIGALAWSPQRGRLVAMGGSTNGGTANLATWEWNPSAENSATANGWGYVVDPLNPSVCVGSSAPDMPNVNFTAGKAVFDDSRNKLVFFVNTDGTATNPVLTYDGVWTVLSLSGSPPARAEAMADYDPAVGRMLVFGGYGYDGNSLNDTWALIGSTWSRPNTANAPPATIGGMMVAGPDGLPLLFGGYSGWVNDQNQTWKYAPGGGGWTQLAPAASPSARRFGAMATDTARSRTVLFGGREGLGPGYLDDTWEWDGTNWTARSPANSPPGRTDSVLSFDPVRSEIVLFGGSNSTGTLGDTWTWDGTNWTARSPANSPPVRSRSTMTWDQATQRVTLFGGLGVSGRINDTWEWNGTDWSQKNPTVQPIAREYARAAYDELNRQLVLFGGTTDSISGNILGDTWMWDGFVWSQDGIATHVRASFLSVFQTLRLAKGANCPLAVATFDSGEVFVSNANVSANTLGLPFLLTPGGTPGIPYVYSVTSGSGITVRSTAGGADASTIGVIFIEPASP
ncbi:MAG: hypothetical protein HY816_19910 [Candidatus Wallbacteria bacterium]|nr:hypothetical protein [Candidatus Wallbacteria bacterium]